MTPTSRRSTHKWVDLFSFRLPLLTDAIHMGLDRTIRFSTVETPSWEAIQTELARVGETPLLRMIDGLPAFPDEIPESGWKELRLGMTAGMVTIRRGLGLLTCMIWGNGDDALRVAWSKVIWACATAGSALIDTPSGPVSPAEFASSSGFSPKPSANQ